MVALAVAPQTDTISGFVAYLRSPVGSVAGDRALSDATAHAYAADLRDLAAWLAREQRGTIAHPEARALADYCATLARERTTTRRCTTLRRYLRWLAAEGYMTPDAAERAAASLPKLERDWAPYSPYYGTLTAADLARVEAKLDAEAAQWTKPVDRLLHQRQRVALRLFSRTAIPQRRLSVATVGALGYAGAEAWLTDADGERWPLDPPCCQALADYLAVLTVYTQATQGRGLRKGDPLLPSLANNAHAEHVSRQGLHYQMIALAHRAGTPPLLATSLRSYALMRALDQGATVREVAERFHLSVHACQRTAHWHKILRAKESIANSPENA
jgi:hypothetical protein